MKPIKLSCFRLLNCISTILLIAFATFAQSVVFGALTNKVTVRRDGRSIPYIEAVNDADLYFTQGYETARDRLWQMDLLRRVARGETAEIFGRQTLEEDKRWRRFGFASVAEGSLQFLSPELRKALDSYAAGVNAYTASLDEKTLPIEFRILQYRPSPWKPTDTIVVGKILADALSTTWRNDLQRASLANIDKEKFQDIYNQSTPYDVILFGNDAAKAAPRGSYSAAPTDGVLAAAEREEASRRKSLERIGFYVEELAASNNWVISGSRTADGKAILANDPHLPPSVPGIWYLTHLSTPTMRVAGVTFPGVPGIVLGHNEHIAWGATNVGPDVQDLYLETFDSNGSAKTAAGPVPTVIRTEPIKVRTNPLKTDTETVNLEVRVTPHGPVIFEEQGKSYSMKWTAFDPKNSEFEAFFLANRAKNWDEFKRALRSYGGAMQNFVYADTKGNIGWYAAGRVPLRRAGDGSLPYDGASSDGDWTGFIPFDELPNLYNPKQGFIVTANQRITGSSYKYNNLISRDAALPWRARRIVDLISGKTKITLDDVRDIQLDTYNIPLSNLARQIVKLEAASPETLSILRAWDGRMNADSEAALLTNEIRNCSAATIAAGHKPVPAPMIRERILYRLSGEPMTRWLPDTYGSYADIFKACDTTVQRDLTNSKRFGANRAKWKWGVSAQSSFAHPLAVAPLVGAQFIIPPVPLNGSGQTPNVASYVSMRHISSPGNWDATRFVIPLGQSGDPRSPHYKDQFEMWRTGSPAVFPFSMQAVEAAAKETVSFAPKN